MAQNYKKTEYRKWSKESMAAAMEDVMKGMGCTEAAEIHEVPLSTLKYRIKKAEKEGLFFAQKKRNCWSKEKMAAAIEDVMKGMGCTEAAETHEVPLSTLKYRIKNAEREGLSPPQKKRNCWSEESMAAAIEDVNKGKMNIPKAAAFYKVPYGTLYDKIKEAEREGLSPLEAASKKLRSTTFLEAQEEELVQHILLFKKSLFGLTSTDIQKLIFEFAEKNNILHMFNKEKEKAGRQWLYSFLSRHKQLSQKNFEETSPASAKGFKRTAVQFQSFFDLLESLYNKYHFSCNEIYIVNETGIIIVPNKSSKVLALRRGKQDSLSSSEEVLVTAETCMNAAGDYMPTMFIFPRKKVDLDLISNAPRDSFAVYHESGLIQKVSFIAWFKKFIEFSCPQPKKPVLLLLDGHASHTKSVKFIKLAQENNVIILSFPPHCIHWLQPLDVSFIPALMTYYKEEVQEWLTDHPGQHVTICKVAELYGKAFFRAAERQTAIDGFKKSGIYPLNKNVLADLNVPSKTTEKPMQQEIQDDETQSVISGNNKIHPSTSTMSSIPIPSQEETNIQKRNKEKEKTANLTSSPYKKQKMEFATRKRKLEIESPKVKKLNKKKKQKDSSSSD
ncbi:uncharacterized protein LOC112466663 [Temnothorax curvispinosus]|uniref:Uncharacterized protein LOC112466663 n=1 Tax=Temnothorax curvispinosus TaxID=300111 RepID=A0A6J1RCZ0_9HYME|nr:uncharacterized protein LOC112466663 [Temnothorax curvispinosus]